MSETLQRTEQVVTVAELREMLDDEDGKSFTDLTSKGVAQVRGGAWRREQTAAGASGGIQTGRMMIDTKCRDVRFGSKADMCSAQAHVRLKLPQMRQMECPLWTNTTYPLLIR